MEELSDGAQPSVKASRRNPKTSMSSESSSLSGRSPQVSVKQGYKRLKLELLKNMGGAVVQSVEAVSRRSDDSPSKCRRIDSSIAKSESIVL